MERELIGENLRRARQALRLSQTTVGKEIGLSRQAVSATESGKRDITVQELIKLANLYRLRVESLFKHLSERSQTHVPRIQRRRNASLADRPLDDHDTQEIQAFIQTLQHAPSTSTTRQLELTGAPRTPFRRLSEIADRVRSMADLQTPPINVYTVLSSFGIRVRMSSLNTISGAFIPGGNNWPPGVLINSDQPSDRQRFSAAHELGHYVLGHAARGEEEIISPLGRRFSPKEVEADSFASELLMPTALVLEESKHLPKSAELEELVYRLADRFLVSFQAMVYRLANLSAITPTQKDALLKVRPSEIETKLQLKQKPRKPFDPAFLKKICETFEADVLQNLLYEPDGVRQLQELAFEEYARQVPEIERADSAGIVYEKVATWVATTFPMPAEK